MRAERHERVRPVLDDGRERVEILEHETLAFVHERLVLGNVIVEIEKDHVEAERDHFGELLERAAVDRLEQFDLVSIGKERDAFDAFEGVERAEKRVDVAVAGDVRDVVGEELLVVFDYFLL